MPQKYKVFLDDRFILFTDKAELTLPHLNYFEPKNFKLLDRVLGNSAQIVSNNPDLTFRQFFSQFESIEAAGGLVENEDKQLFIFRNGKWDLPKGKLELDESIEVGAIREIQEECGLNGDFSLVRKLPTTFHTYHLYGKDWIKTTYWFLFDYSGDNTVQPQTEEGISKVVWLEKSQLKEVYENTYPNILEVLNENF